MTSWEPPGSPSFPAFEEKNQETMTSQEAHRHLLHMRKKPRNDDELRASQLVVILHLKKKTKRRQQVERLVVVFCT